MNSKGLRAGPSRMGVRCGTPVVVPAGSMRLRQRCGVNDVTDDALGEFRHPGLTHSRHDVEETHRDGLPVQVRDAGEVGRVVRRGQPLPTENLRLNVGSHHEPISGWIVADHEHWLDVTCSGFTKEQRTDTHRPRVGRHPDILPVTSRIIRDPAIYQRGNSPHRCTPVPVAIGNRTVPCSPLA